MRSGRKGSLGLLDQLTRIVDDCAVEDLRNRVGVRCTSPEEFHGAYCSFASPQRLTPATAATSPARHPPPVKHDPAAPRTQQPAPSTQHPAPNTQAAGLTAQPVTSIRDPEAVRPLSGADAVKPRHGIQVPGHGRPAPSSDTAPGFGAPGPGSPPQGRLSALVRSGSCQRAPVRHCQVTSSAEIAALLASLSTIPLRRPHPHISATGTRRSPQRRPRDRTRTASPRRTAPRRLTRRPG